MLPEPRRESRSGYSTAVGLRATAIRRSAAHLEAVLDRHGQEFARSDLDDDLRGRVDFWIANDVIEKEGRIEGEDQTFVWRIPDNVATRVREHMDQTDTLPCGHTGVSNIRNGGFECSTCGKSVTREQAEVVLW